MKREELIKLLILLKEQARSSGVNTFVWDINIDSFNFVIDSAIQALEQEPILDKIKAEIEFEVDHRTNMLCAEDVFAILDKYKAETEAEDGKNVLVGCIGCKYSGVPKHAVCNSCINMSRYEQEMVEDGKID